MSGWRRSGAGEVASVQDRRPKGRFATKHRGLARREAVGRQGHRPFVRIVRYTRHEPHGLPEQREAPLSVFVYDVPYLPASGLLPPLHLLSPLLMSGGSEGGMGPGATWEPFNLSISEYEELVASLATQSASEVSQRARYAEVPLAVDPSFDHINDRFAWAKAVMEAHGERYRLRVRELSATGRERDI